MPLAQQIAAIAIVFTSAGIRPLMAQIDYRNLDDDRPVSTEDAYPIERYAFEATVPYRFESGSGGSQLHLIVPELAYGLLSNAEVGLEIPIGAIDLGADTDWGLAGPQLFGFYNFNTESPIVPALAIRGDLSLPIGSLAGKHTRFTLKAIATRSWGRSRFHFNLARSFGSEKDPASAEPPDRWAYSLAVDRTLLRQSLLLIGGLEAGEALQDAPTEVNATFGARYQWGPTLVLDVGIARRLRSDLGPDFALTLGLSHAFAFRGLMPAGLR